jgi:hypothetical protein
MTTSDRSTDPADVELRRRRATRAAFIGTAIESDDERGTDPVTTGDDAEGAVAEVS